MIEVKVQPIDGQEVEMLNELLLRIAQKRTGRAVQATQAAQAAQAAQAQYVAKSQAAPAPAAAPAAPPAAAPDIIAAATALGQRDFPKLRALLDEFGAKRVSDVPEARHAEFIGRTQEA